MRVEIIAKDFPDERPFELTIHSRRALKGVAGQYPSLDELGEMLSSVRRFRNGRVFYVTGSEANGFYLSLRHAVGGYTEVGRFLR